MNEKNCENRRQFLQSGAMLMGASWLSLNAPAVLAAGRAAADNMAQAAGFKNISPEDAVELAAIADQIIPADESPAASEVGVVYFIDAALGGFMASGADGFFNGLRDLQQKVGAAHPKRSRFAELSGGERTALLKTVEDSPFFGMVHFLTLAGMFTLPQYGGNRDEAGWKLVGFDHRHVWQPPFGYYDIGHHGVAAAAARDSKK